MHIDCYYQQMIIIVAIQLHGNDWWHHCFTALFVLHCIFEVCDVLQGQWTALHYAAQKGHTNCVKELCVAGATVDAKDGVSNMYCVFKQEFVTKEGERTIACTNALHKV